MARALSSHLDEYYHVFSDGTTARLHVTPWDRNTVADGAWQNVNTIKPLSSRDVYLAECIDDLSSKQIIYSAGSGISIDPVPDSDKFEISLTSLTLTSYDFQSGFSATEDSANNKVTVEALIDNETIKLNHDGELCCNSDGVIATSYSAQNINITKDYEYHYNIGDLPIVFTGSIPTAPPNNNPSAGSILFIG